MSKQPNHLDRSSGVALEPTVPVKKQAPNIRQESTPLPLDLVIRNSRQKQTTHRPSTVKQLDTVTLSSLPVAPNPHSTQANASLSQIEPEEAVHDASPDPAVYHHHWLSLEESDLKKSDRIKMINDFLVSPERIPILVARLNEAAEDDRPPIDDDEQRFGNVNVDEMSDSTKQDYEQFPKMTVALSTMDMNCHICTKPIAQVAVMQPCHHTFCTVCALEWFKYCPKCPDCRRPIKSIALNIVNMSTYDSFPESYPNECELFAGRFLKAMMLQFLAVHYEHYPELGYPPRKLDFESVDSITKCAMANRLQRFRLFRSLVYFHNYESVHEFPVRQIHSIGYFPRMNDDMKRLWVCFKEDFGMLRQLFPASTRLDESSIHLKRILAKHPIGSIECQQQFVDTYKPIIKMLSSELRDTVMRKMFHEMQMYAKSPIDKYEDFFKTISYDQTKEALCFRHFGKNVKRTKVENHSLAENEIRNEPTSGQTECAVGRQSSTSSGGNGTPDTIGTVQSSFTCVIQGAIESMGTNPANVIDGASGSIRTSCSNVIRSDRNKVPDDGDVEFIGDFGMDSLTCLFKQEAPELPMENGQPTSEAIKRPLEPVPQPSRVVRRRNSLDGREGAPAWSHLLPLSRIRNNNLPTPLSAEAIHQRRLRRKEEMKIRRAGYSLKEIRDMRRTVRLSANSTFYYRELMSEVKKWFSGIETVLEAFEFSRQLQPYFTDMASAYEYFQLIPKPVIKMEEMTGTILLEKIEQFKADVTNFKRHCGLEEPNEPDDRPKAPTPSDDASMARSAQLELSGGDQVERQQNKAINEQNYKQMSTETCLKLIKKAKNNISFLNHTYTSESDLS